MVISIVIAAIVALILYCIWYRIGDRLARQDEMCVLAMIYSSPLPVAAAVYVFMLCEWIRSC